MNLSRLIIGCLSSLLLTQHVYAGELVAGLNLIGASSTKSLSLNDYDDTTIEVVYGINPENTTSYLTFKPSNTKDSRNTLKGFTSNIGYLVKSVSAENSIDFVKENLSVQECEITIVNGLNIVALNNIGTLSVGSLTKINGADIEVIYAINPDNTTSYLTYKPSNTKDSRNTLKSIEDGEYYLIKATSASTGICSSLETPPGVPDMNSTSTLQSPPTIPTVQQ
jgi:hypothetical protein